MGNGESRINFPVPNNDNSFLEDEDETVPTWEEAMENLDEQMKNLFMVCERFNNEMNLHRENSKNSLFQNKIMIAKMEENKYTEFRKKCEKLTSLFQNFEVLFNEDFNNFMSNIDEIEEEPQELGRSEKLLDADKALEKFCDASRKLKVITDKEITIDFYEHQEKVTGKSYVLKTVLEEIANEIDYFNRDFQILKERGTNSKSLVAIISLYDSAKMKVSNLKTLVEEFNFPEMKRYGPKTIVIGDTLYAMTSSLKRKLTKTNEDGKEDLQVIDKKELSETRDKLLKIFDGVSIDEYPNVFQKHLMEKFISTCKNGILDAMNMLEYYEDYRFNKELTKYFLELISVLESLEDSDDESDDSDSHEDL